MLVRKRLVACLVALLVVACAVTVWLALNEPEADDTPGATGTPPVINADGTYVVGTLPGDQAKPLAVAVEALPSALTYDFRDIPGSVRAATASMTPAFAAQFKKVFAETALKMARDKQAVTDAHVRAAGVIASSNPDTVLCLLYVDQVLVSSETLKEKQSPVDVVQNRVLVELVDSDGTWLVNSITPL